MSVKRFGVSLPREVAEALDKMAHDLGVTRSEIVTHALQEYIQEKTTHHNSTHQCIGVVLALSDSGVDLSDLLHRDVVLTYSHMHLEQTCLTVAVVRGDGSQIARYVLEISRKSHTVRYVPLY